MLYLARDTQDCCVERKEAGGFRRLLAAGLLLILMLHPQAWNSWALLLRAKIKSEVHRMQISGHLEKDLPVLIKIPLSSMKGEASVSLIWTEADEFRYQGQMYDVLREEVHGDTLWYYCHHDKAETDLLDGIFEEIQADTPAMASAHFKWTPGFLFEQWQVSGHPLFPSFTLKHGAELNISRLDLAGRMLEAPLQPPPRSIFSA